MPVRTVKTYGTKMFSLGKDFLGNPFKGSAAVPAWNPFPKWTHLQAGSFIWLLILAVQPSSSLILTKPILKTQVNFRQGCIVPTRFLHQCHPLLNQDMFHVGFTSSRPLSSPKHIWVTEQVKFPNKVTLLMGRASPTPPWSCAELRSWSSLGTVLLLQCCIQTRTSSVERC